MDKPILLLDVDGVINVIGDGSNKIEIHTPRPRNFVKFMDDDSVDADHTLSFFPGPFWKELLTWADQHTELWWCTCWFGGANGIGKVAGISFRPWIEQKRFVENEDFKLTNVKDQFKDDTRRIIWIEDGFQPETEAWAKTRPDTHLIKTNFKIGLTAAIMSKIKSLA